MDEIKLKLQEKYLPVSYKQHLLDQWQRLTQGNRPVSEYIKKFDQFLVRRSENESNVIVLSKFHSGLKDELRRELIVRDISTLEQVIQVVQELDQFQASSFPRRLTIGIIPTGLLLNFNPIHPNLSLILDLVTPTLGMKTKAKESQVSRLDPFNRLNVSNAKGKAMFQDNHCFKYRPIYKYIGRDNGILSKTI